MKRIIFSIYTNKIDPYVSAPLEKQSQFVKYKEHLENCQKEYADLCHADYKLFETHDTNYVNIQFEKLIKAEELTQEYDEVLYLDFDVVPQTKVSIFQEFNFQEYLIAYATNRHPILKEIQYHNKEDDWHPQDVFLKTSLKNAMLLLDDIDSNPFLINTGVIGLSKNICNKIDFTNRIKECDDRLEEAKIDNLYPKEMSRVWSRNNEAYFTYIVNKYNIPWIDPGIQWNFMLTKKYPDISPSAHFVHHVNKEFELSFDL